MNECEHCEMKPGKCIYVDNVRNPVCPECGKKLLTCDHVWVYIDESLYRKFKDTKKEYVYWGAKFHCKYCRKIVIDETKNERPK